jgi:hypothetical protein
MPREKESYRDNLEQILTFSGGRQMLKINEVMEFTGIRHYQTIHRMFPFINGYISAATLARCLGGGA